MAQGAMPFSLNGATTKCTTGSGSSTPGAIAMGGNTSVLVTNAGTVIAFIRSATSGAIATTSDTPILPSTAQTFSIPPDHTSVAAIAASACDVYFTVGSGT